MSDRVVELYQSQIAEMIDNARADAIDEYYEQIQSVAFGRRKGIVHMNDIVAIMDKLKERKNE